MGNGPTNVIMYFFLKPENYEQGIITCIFREQDLVSRNSWLDTEEMAKLGRQQWLIIYERKLLDTIYGFIATVFW